MDEDGMEPIPPLVTSSDTSSENAQKSFRSVASTNTRPVGTYTNDIQERITFPLKSDCTLGDMTISANDEDPLELFKSSYQGRHCDQGGVFPTAEAASQIKDRSVDDMLKFLFDSKCSIDIPAEGEEALELDQPRPENHRNEPHVIMSPTANDVLCGKGGKTVDHNIHYTRLCAQVADEYVATKKRGWNGKKGVALRVVRAVQLSGGRFLKPSSTGVGWDVVYEKASVDKAAHCIRDLIHRRQRTRRRHLRE
jgi:hypothetical protein